MLYIRWYLPAVSQIRGSLSVTFPIFSQHSSASFKLICQLAARWRRNIFLKSSRLTVAFIDIEFPCSSAFVTILLQSACLPNWCSDSRDEEDWSRICLLRFTENFLQDPVPPCFYPVSFSGWLCVPFMISMIDFMHSDKSSGRCLSLYLAANWSSHILFWPVCASQHFQL